MVQFFTNISKNAGQINLQFAYPRYREPLIWELENQEKVLKLMSFLKLPKGKGQKAEG
jgi:hypothetical protein